MSDKSKSTTFLLCYFLGLFGVHRFYAGRVKTGVLMLVTLGGVGIWWLVDSVLIAADQFTDGDDRPLRTGPPDPDDLAAGFWVRVAAMSVDTVILMLVIAVVLMASGIGLAMVLPYLDIDLSAFETPGPDGTLTEAQMATSMLLTGAVVLLEVVLMLIYFSIQHGSRHQATVGKRCFGLRVTAGGGDRVGYGRALWRAAAYILSGIPLYLGYVLAAFTRDKRALHDYLAGTRVRYVDDGSDAGVSRIAAPQGPPAAQAAAASAAAERPGRTDGDSGSGTLLIVVGALLLAGAVAAGMLL